MAARVKSLEHILQAFLISRDSEKNDHIIEQFTLK